MKLYPDRRHTSSTAVNPGLCTAQPTLQQHMQKAVERLLMEQLAMPLLPKGSKPCSTDFRGPVAQHCTHPKSSLDLVSGCTGGQQMFTDRSDRCTVVWHVCVRSRDARLQGRSCASPTETTRTLWQPCCETTIAAVADDPQVATDCHIPPREPIKPSELEAQRGSRMLSMRSSSAITVTT